MIDNDKSRSAIRLRDQLAAEMYFPLNVTLVLCELSDKEYEVVQGFAAKLSSSRRELDEVRPRPLPRVAPNNTNIYDEEPE